MVPRRTEGDFRQVQEVDFMARTVTPRRELLGNTTKDLGMILLEVKLGERVYSAIAVIVGKSYRGQRLVKQW